MNIWIRHVEHTNSIKNTCDVSQCDTKTCHYLCYIKCNKTECASVLEFYFIKCCKWKQYIQINHLPSTRLLHQNNATRPLIWFINWLPQEELYHEIQILLWFSRVSPPKGYSWSPIPSLIERQRLCSTSYIGLLLVEVVSTQPSVPWNRFSFYYSSSYKTQTHIFPSIVF